MPARQKPFIRSATEIDHSLLDGYQHSNRFGQWLKQVEKIVGSPLQKLDSRDPVRRKVKPSTWDEQAEFIASFKPRERSRRTFGYFEDERYHFHIELHRDRQDFWDRVVWVIEPESISVSELADKLGRLFDTGNRILRPFYSIADTEANFATKAKKSGYGVDMQAELIGIFWLTYFNKKYVNFFGPETLAEVKECQINSKGEARLQLGQSPTKYRSTRRLQIENKLGADSFIAPSSRRDKPHGEYVLTFEKLRGRKS